MKKRKQKHFTTKNTHLRRGRGKNVNSIKSNNTMRFNKIREPKTIDEFRKNLLKYYFSDGNNVYTQEIGYVDVNELTCIQDLIEKVQNRGFVTLNLTPKVVELNNWKKYVLEKMKNYKTSQFSKQRFIEEFWEDNDSHVIIFNNDDFMVVCKKIMGNIFWKNILQPMELYTIFHNKVMGEFGLYPDWELTKDVVFSTF